MKKVMIYLFAFLFITSFVIADSDVSSTTQVDFYIDDGTKESEIVYYEVKLISPREEAIKFWGTAGIIVAIIIILGLIFGKKKKKQYKTIETIKPVVIEKQKPQSKKVVKKSAKKKKATKKKKK